MGRSPVSPASVPFPERLVALPTTDQPSELDAARLRPRIDAALDHYSHFDAGCPPQLAAAIRYALLAPGKRLRPQLVLLAADACGGPVDGALPAACAVEMVHAYSLVHDDLPAMDDDDLRRGRPTCHVAYGEAVAILVGDALLARSFEVLAREIKPPALAAECCAVLARAAGATALVGGQADDLALEAAGDIDGDRNALEAIHARKTGALIMASLELGGIAAGGTSTQLSALQAFGRNLGLAFQITDDLLDVSGNEDAMGKRVAKDAGRGKRTFPQLLGVDESRRQAAKLIDDACGMIELFGPRAEPLRKLARFVATRES
jgi:geranylgeranyl diphosphate synthase, type II